MVTLILIPDGIYTPAARYSPPCADHFRLLLPHAIDINTTHIMIQQASKVPTYEGGSAHEPRMTEKAHTEDEKHRYRGMPSCSLRMGRELRYERLGPSFAMHRADPLCTGPNLGLPQFL